VTAWTGLTNFEIFFFVDDIFADSSPAPKQKTKKSTTATKDDIIDDPLA
jgi:hypothetical protein